jgi:hypothetical protein
MPNSDFLSQRIARWSSSTNRLALPSVSDLSTDRYY